MSLLNPACHCDEVLCTLIMPCKVVTQGSHRRVPGACAFYPADPPIQPGAYGAMASSRKLPYYFPPYWPEPVTCPSFSLPLQPCTTGQGATAVLLLRGGLQKQIEGYLQRLRNRRFYQYQEAVDFVCHCNCDQLWICRYCKSHHVIETGKCVLFWFRTGLVITCLFPAWCLTECRWKYCELLN